LHFIWHFRKSPVLRSSRGNNPNADATRKSENFFQKSSVLIGSFIFSGVVGIKRKSKTVSGKVSKTCNTDGCTDEGTHKKQKVPVFQSKILPQYQNSLIAHFAPAGILLGSAFPKPCYAACAA